MTKMSICVVAGVVTSWCSEWIVAFLTGLPHARGLKSNSRQNEKRSILLSLQDAFFLRPRGCSTKDNKSSQSGNKNRQQHVSDIHYITRPDLTQICFRNCYWGVVPNVVWPSVVSLFYWRCRRYMSLAGYIL